MKHSAAVFLCLCILLSGCAGSREPVQTTAQTLPPQTESTAASLCETEPAEEHFLLTFVGDCTLGTEARHTGSGMGFLRTVGQDYSYPFRNVEPFFAADDLTFANLEGTLTNTGNPVQKKWRFRGPEDYVKILSEHSVEAVSLSNNHSMDYGQEGYDNTRRVLQEAGIPYVERDKTLVIPLEQGLTLGVYGAMYTYIDEAAMTEAVSRLKQETDLVIFAPHWGWEKSYTPNEEQVRLAHAAIDAGADLVWGHHTHTLQPMEHYGDGIIFYSMGNFCFGGNMYPADYDSAIWQQEILRSPEGEITLGETRIIPVCISSREDFNNFQPTPYEAGSPGWQRVMEKVGGE